MKDNGLIYGLEERPPLKDTLFAALQHLLAIFVWNSNDTNGKCPLWAVGGLHEYSTNLPSSLLGQTKVYVRIKASTNKCCGNSKPVTDRYAATISSASGGRIRLGEISVEYN